MGYYTKYDLDVIDEKNKNEIGMRDFYEEKICGDVGFKYLFDEEQKWYRHEDDMIKLSVQYPNQIFILSGKGEDTIDSWKKYFQNGKFYTVFSESDFPKFDKSKLKLKTISKR